MNNTALQGLLTSRIELRQDKLTNEPYYYGFFKVEGQDQDIPIIFKEKPNLTKGTPLQLTGQWATSNGSRPSFTVTDYQILADSASAKPKLANIYQKLHLIQSQTGKIAKSELNKFQNYKYF